MKAVSLIYSLIMAIRIKTLSPETLWLAIYDCQFCRAYISHCFSGSQKIKLHQTSKWDFNLDYNIFGAQFTCTTSGTTASFKKAIAQRLLYVASQNARTTCPCLAVCQVRKSGNSWLNVCLKLNTFELLRKEQHMRGLKIFPSWIPATSSPNKIFTLDNSLTTAGSER